MGTDTLYFWWTSEYMVFYFAFYNNILFLYSLWTVNKCLLEVKKEYKPGSNKWY